MRVADPVSITPPGGPAGDTKPSRAGPGAAAAPRKPRGLLRCFRHGGREARLAAREAERGDPGDSDGHGAAAPLIAARRRRRLEPGPECGWTMGL